MERKSYGPDNSPEARTGRLIALADYIAYKTPIVKEIIPKPPITPPDYDQPNADQLAA